MGSEVYILTDQSSPILARELALGAETWLNRLLNASSAVKLDLKIYCDSHAVERAIGSDGKLYQFRESLFCNSGGALRYCANHFMDEPPFQFVVHLSKWLTRLYLLEICLSASAADLLGQTQLLEHEGYLYSRSKGELLHVDDLASAALNEKLPPDAAVEELLDRLKVHLGVHLIRPIGATA